MLAPGATVPYLGDHLRLTGGGFQNRAHSLIDEVNAQGLGHGDPTAREHSRPALESIGTPRRHRATIMETRQLLRCVSLVAVLGALLTASGLAQSISEYQMKAAYVYNLAKFVQWPPEAFKNASDPIAICVLGQSPILGTLNEAVNGETIEDRRLIVRQVSDLQEASNCHILFIGSSERKYSQPVLRDLKTTGILTVGETAGFAAKGGVVNFRRDANKVRIEINLSAAGLQKLRISPKLLSLAQIVKK